MDTGHLEPGTQIGSGPLFLMCLLPLHLWAQRNNLITQEKTMSPCNKFQGRLDWFGWITCLFQSLYT